MLSTVLLIDEEGPTRDLWRHALRATGWRVCVSSSVEHGLASCPIPSVVIAAARVLHRSTQDDRQALEQLIARSKALPFLLEERSGAARREEHALLGNAERLSRPLSPGTLVQQVRAACASRGLPVPTFERRRVLVADDDPLQRRLLHVQLAQLGFLVLSAADGAQALDSVQLESPVAVIADTLMPRLDGFSLAFTVRQDPRFARTLMVLSHPVEPTELDLRLAQNVGAFRLVKRDPDAEPLLLSLLEGLDSAARHESAPLEPAPLPELEEHLFGVIRQLERQVVLHEQTEHSLRMSEKRAQQAVFARDEFIAIAAHELRTPLTAMQLHLQGWRRRTAESHEESSLEPSALTLAQRTIASVERGVRRLSTLVSVLLDASHSERAVPLTLQTVELGAVLALAVERARDAAERAGCELKFVREGDAPLLIRADSERLEQVVDRLLGNAFKFGHGAPIEVRLTSDGNDACFSVRDHGVGIPPGELSRIFGRFERAASTEHYGGLGLGLYLVDQIVRAHGGAVSATSAPGAGSTFTVRLPCTEPVQLGLRA